MSLDFHDHCRLEHFLLSSQRPTIALLKEHRLILSFELMAMGRQK